VRERLRRLKAELETLYRAAGEPTEESLAQAVKSHPHGGPITVSTISAWRRGQYAPLREYTGRFMVLVDVLKRKADGTPGYRPLTEGEWGNLLTAAQEESKARQRSGPGRKRTPPRADGHAGPVRLPADVAGFSGRAALLEELRDWLAPSAGQASPVVSVVAGMPGAGKTALVVRASHQAQQAGWFPGGIIFEDLRGFSTDEPIEHGTAAARLLGTLGARQQDVPLTPPERALALQALLGRLKSQQRPVLIVLDNAATAGQVRPLRPSPGSPHRMIITSRDTLSILEARQFEVPPLGPDEALDLLDRALQGRHPGDDRVARDQADARRLARLCGHLPLALQIVAALLSDEQDLSIADQARELADVRTRLERLHRDDLAVRAAFDLSYERGHLTPDQARAFRLLAVIPGPDASTAAAAAMLGLPEGDARGLLKDLHRAHLLGKRTGSRWIMHDLIRLYAGERAAGQAADDQPEAALDRLYAYYRNSAGAADLWLRLPRAAVQKAQPERFDSRDQASAWLDDEAPSLVAAVSAAHASGRWTDAHSLAARLGNYFEDRYRFDDWITTGSLDLQAAEHIGREEKFAATANLGRAYRLAGQYDQSVTQLELALSMAPDDRSRSPVLHNLGLAYFRLGKFGKAGRLHRIDLDICYRLGDGRGGAQAAVALGDALRGQKRFPEAAEVLELAIGMLQHLDALGFGDPIALMNARQNLALTYLDADPGHTAARIIWQLCAALALARDHGNDHARATIYLNLSAAYRSKCTATYRNSSFTWAQQALQLFRKLGDHESEARALMSIGQAYALTGNLPAARLHANQAREIFDGLGATTHSSIASELLAEIPRIPPAPVECAECRREAESFRSWLEDLPHAVLRGNDDRLHEFSQVTSVRWNQATRNTNQRLPSPQGL
jgi:tetratricopeptide (TPR) repeat protein